jgi:hypothetical protein
MDAKNINVLIGENEISYSKSNENENDFINNLYDHGLQMYGNQFLENKFVK